MSACSPTPYISLSLSQPSFPHLLGPTGKHLLPPAFLLPSKLPFRFLSPFPKPKQTPHSYPLIAADSPFASAAALPAQTRL